MQSIIIRLALGQCTVVIYCVLAVGVMLKARFGGVIPPIPATYLRDYGFLLLTLPAAWLVWAAFSAHRPRANTGDAGSILLVGLAVLGFLVVLAFMGTFSACVQGTLLVTTPGRPAAASTPSEMQ